MKITTLEDKISKIPIIVKSNKESLLCLNKPITIIDGHKLKENIDDLSARIADQNIAIISNDSSCRSRFPRVAIKERFLELDFNRHFCNKLDLASQLFLKQSQIRNLIYNEASRYDFIVLIIVDGLSYTDCLSWEGTMPCLVDTLTTTDCAFRNIVGTKGSIPRKLFSKNYTNFLGYSYWGENDKNQLNDFIFKDFSRLEKIQSLDQAIDQMNQVDLKNTYIQIATQGLDGIAHISREKPLIEPMVNRIYEYVQKIVTTLRGKGLKGIIHLTSDHGILWKHQCNFSETLLPSSSRPRYSTTPLPKDISKTVITYKNKVSAMKYPHILRKLKSNEWGVHGGISLEESIVPFFSMNINSK